MKWPNSVTMIRHGESSYNALKAKKEADPEYHLFLQAYENRKKKPKIAKAIAKSLLKDGRFVLGTSDYDTPLTEAGRQQSEITGAMLRERATKKPDVVLVSPYGRTRQTRDGLAVGWPELNEVKTVEDERIREQEHGLSLLYSDRRIFNVMHPEQEQLYNQEGSYWYRFPQGESVPDVRERWRSMTGTFTRDYVGKDILVVTHHLSILAFRANMERLDAHGFKELDHTQKPINCGVTVYLGDSEQGTDGRMNLDLYNERLY